MAITEDSYFDSMGVKHFRDPVFGSDIFLSPFELQIINTQVFQRLRGIKQLGPCEIVWHGATHNRFQHSLGTLFMVDKILNYADPKGRIITLPRRIICRLFALLHDIGHVPFGHTLEDERPSIPGHHTDRERIKKLFSQGIDLALIEIEKEMDEDQKRDAGIGLDIGKRKINSLRELLIELIAECKGETDATDEKPSKIPGELKLYLDIVGNTICADLLDYLKLEVPPKNERWHMHNQLKFKYSSGLIAISF